MDEIKLQTSILAALLGKPPPPWTITDAEGAPTSLRLQDMKERWVVIAFWSSNEGTFVPPSIQELFDFEQRRWRSLKEKFQLIVFHDKNVAKFNDIKDLIVRNGVQIKRDDEQGIILLFDSSGTTLKEWGIDSLPRFLLVDPKGNLSDCGDLSAVGLLKRKVEVLGDQ